MYKFLTTAAVVLTTVGLAQAAISSGEASRLTSAANAIRDVRSEIAPEFWNRARCVAVIPELKKAAFIVGDGQANRPTCALTG